MLCVVKYGSKPDYSNPTTLAVVVSLILENAWVERLTAALGGPSVTLPADLRIGDIPHIRARHA